MGLPFKSGLPDDLTGNRRAATPSEIGEHLKKMHDIPPRRYRRTREQIEAQKRRAAAINGEEYVPPDAA